jgi:hypothetical protein
MGADTENDILTFESGHLGQAQTCLYGQQNEGMITAARPCALIRSSQQGIDFGTCEKLDRSMKRRSDILIPAMERQGWVICGWRIGRGKMFSLSGIRLERRSVWRNLSH